MSTRRPDPLLKGSMMRTPCRLARGLIGACLALNLIACAVKPSAVSSQRIADIVASPDRSAADRTNDLRRKPAQMLAFIGVRPGISALDVSAGGGYTAELLARAIGPTGTVYGQSQPRNPDRAPPAPAAPEGASHPASAPEMVSIPTRTPPPRSSLIALTERGEKLRNAGIAAATIVPVSRSFDNPVPPALAVAQVDLVTLMFNYHDLGFQGVDRVQMNRAIFRALKPGGHYVIADHAGRPGTGISESGTLHRIEETFLRSEVEAVGFRFVADADFLRNPSDPRDKNTPEPPQPKDEFVLKFVKP